MNPPVKKGKYSMVDDESIQSCSTHLQQQQNNLKQCEYVSNRTRLRCQNFKSIDELKDFGFCNEHQGYIERIRKEGLRTKHLFDPNFNITEGFLELISFDDDETLDSRVPTDFPFIYEPLYCESRLDGDENPLRNAGIFNKKEILNEYCRAIKRCQAAIREQRLIYREKHSKIVRQGIRLAEQPNPVQIDPIKNGEKIQRLNVMRRDALRLDQRQVFKEKFARLDTDLIEKCVGKRNKWLQQIEHPIDENERIVSQLVTEMVDLIVLTKSKRGPKTMLIPSTMHLIGKQNFVSSSTNSSSSTSNSSSSTAIFYPLPNTIIDILKQFKNCYFEEYERKIKEEEEREEIERQKRLGRKIAIKMVNNNNNSSSTTTSTGAATNIGISRGSSISSDGQQQQPHQPQPPTPLKTKIQNILTSSTTLAAHQQQSSSQKQSQNNLKNKKTLIYSKINKNNVRQQQQPLNQHIHPQIKKRLVNENQIGYFSTIQLGGGQSSSFSTTTPQQQQPPKIINSVANNYLDPHGYLSSSSTTYLRPSTSTATTIYNNNGNLLNNNFNKRIIRPISIDEDINPDVFLQLTHPQLTEKYGGNNNKRGGGGGRLASVELVDEDDDDFNEDYNNNDSSTFVCARINLPWNGKRKTPFKKNTKILLFDTQQKLQQETKEKNVNKNDNNNNGYVQYVANVLSRYSSTIL